jgi:hypothetical protein
MHGSVLVPLFCNGWTCACGNNLKEEKSIHFLVQRFYFLLSGLVDSRHEDATKVLLDALYVLRAHAI